MKRTPLVIAQALAAILVVIWLAACGREPSQKAERDASDASRSPITVEVAVATAQSIPRMSTASGVLAPRRRVSPGTKILGRVEKVTVREGDRVDTGTLLARFEDRDLRAAVGQAEAAVRMAEAQLDQARAQEERMTNLHARGSVTDKNLEDATAAFRVAEAARAQAKANLEAARVRLSYAEIRSPLAGWVVAKHVEAGDMATPGSPLFTLEDLSQLEAQVAVPEADIVDLLPGATARLEVLDRDFVATIDRVVPAGDATSRTFTVKLLLDNPDGELKSGMFARASFSHGMEEILAIPASAVIERGQLEGLYVASKDGSAHLRWVKTGRRLPAAGGDATTSAVERIEILSGLVSGERYVVAPPPQLSDGATIEVEPQP